MKRGFTFIEAAVCVAIVVILAAILIPVFARTRCYETRYPCPGNLKALQLGATMYSRDYDDHFPRANVVRPAFGWADALAPYVGENERRLQCSREKTVHPIPGALQTLYTDYWMNRRVSGLNVKGLVTPSQTVLFGDGNEGTAGGYQYYAVSSLPPSWIDDDDSPLARHTGGAFYSFADGHVKFINAGQITSADKIDTYFFVGKSGRAVRN